jgi:predicted phage tail protein
MISQTSITSERTAARTVSAYPLYDRPFARISWGAVFAGAIIALATQIVLALIGMAIGLATLNPATGDSPSGTALGAGAAIWLVVSSLVSLFIGGYIAARLAGRFNGWLHGLVTWGTLTLLSLILLTTAAGQLIGAASGLTNFAVSNSDKGSRLPSALQQQVDQFRTQTNQAADQAAAQAQSTDPQTREAQTRDAGQKAAKGGAVGTGAAAFAMILGAIAAAMGGRTGERTFRDNVEDTVGGDDRRASDR